MNHKTGNKPKIKSNDITYTHQPNALVIIKLCKIKNGSKVFDPSKGGGVLYEKLPFYCIKDYCEITDFFLK
jgi:hypothetical protein